MKWKKKTHHTELMKQCICCFSKREKISQAWKKLRQLCAWNFTRKRFHSIKQSIQKELNDNAFDVWFYFFLPQQQQKKDWVQIRNVQNTICTTMISHWVRPQLNYIRTYFRIHCMINIIIAFYLHSILMNRSNTHRKCCVECWWQP